VNGFTADGWKESKKEEVNMRKVIAVALALTFAAGPAFASSASSPTYTMKASIQDEITIAVKWFATNTDPNPADEIFGTTIDWGNLVFDATNNVYNGDKARLALITLNNHRRAYTCTQTGTALVNGANSIPNANYQVNPVYVASDNGGAANEGTMGSAGTAVAVNKTLYTSGGTHSLRVIRAYYSLTNVPADQPVGTYQGTLQFTITG
jgi:hypothetical protein